MKTNVNLKTYNSFGFDAVAKEFVEINDANELQTLIRRGQLKNKDVLVLAAHGVLRIERAGVDIGTEAAVVLLVVLELLLV